MLVVDEDQVDPGAEEECLRVVAHPMEGTWVDLALAAHLEVEAVVHGADGMEEIMTKITEVVDALGDIVNREVAAMKLGTTMSTWLTTPKTTVIATTLAVMIMVMVRVIRNRPSSIICKKRVGSKRPPR